MGIGNDLFTMLRDIITNTLKHMPRGKKQFEGPYPPLKQVIDETTAMRDSWDLSDDCKQLKTLTQTVAAYRRQWEEISISAGEKTNVDDK